ncbi:TetR/AcrR family transcriptional regulator [Myceligenerans crystallogenes]|uniref:HTH tetR-type domain-containing protein n=1 Tax=Myceligenerans crystallogenes TaxID=316335 RepID=A0ABN2NCE5_9MICO
MTAEPLPDNGAGAEPETPVERALAALTPLTPRRERTRARLLDAAYAVFARDGIKGASIEVICETAGFTRGAFYSNFDSKEALFLALADRLKRRQLAALESAAHSLDPETIEGGRIHRDAIAHVLGAMVAEKPDDARQWTMLHAELQLLAMRDARVAELVAAHDSAVRQEVSELLAGILETLGLRFVVDDEAAVDLLFATHQHCARRQAFAHAPGDDDAAAGHDPLNDLVGLLVTTRD